MPIGDDDRHSNVDNGNGKGNQAPRERERLALIRGTQSTDVAVVGAGPYGLSVAAHLRGADIEARVFGEPMAGWRHHMPKGMYLKSTFDASSLSAPAPGSSLADYCAATGTRALDERHPVPLDMFIDYGLWFQDRHVKDVERLEVRRVAAVPGGFRISLSDGEDFSARTVVIAAGQVSFAYLPDELHGLVDRTAALAAPVSHACEHADFSRFAGRSVAVICAGQSALESATLLREAGAEVHVLIRGRNILWGGPPGDTQDHLLRRIAKPASPLGPGWSLLLLSRAPELVAYLPAHTRRFLVRTVLGPSGAWWLRDRFERRINVATETVVEAARLSNGKVSLHLRGASKASSTLAVDHVVAATGYKVNLDAVQLLDSPLRQRVARVNGSFAPRLSHSFESSVPGLYFTGLSAAATFGPVLRFVCGSGFTARTIHKALTGLRSSRAARRR